MDYGSDRVSSARPRALFAISSLGLGHATRSLVVLRSALRRGYAVTVVAHGNALNFLRMELAGEREVQFRDMPDYPPLERGSGWRLYAYLAIDLVRTWWRICAEHRAVCQLADGHQFIFSDGRYGFYSRNVPSFILSHQIAFLPPRGLRWAMRILAHINIRALRRFDRVFIPDFPETGTSLAGMLSHPAGLSPQRHVHVGLLSSYPHQARRQDIDVLFVISGYLLEHKDAFIRELLDKARQLPGHKVFVLGQAGGDDAAYDAWRSQDLRIHGVASGTLRHELFARARCVVSRAGYTTVMDLVEHDKPALLIPTPNQTEQEYLAACLGEKGHFAVRKQSALGDLSHALDAARQACRFNPPWRTQASLAQIDASMAALLRKPFVTIVVPAHNEQSQIAPTLRCLLAQRYPVDRMEIIVVENGSTDATLETAQCLSEAPQGRGRIRVLQTALGVSRAKNAGLAAASEQAEWVVLCDADTRLGPDFLAHLATWLNRHVEYPLAVGTTSVRPLASDSRYARLWFTAFDVIHRLTRSSFALQIAAMPLAREVGFHEGLQLAEDLAFIRACRRSGRFFFVPTDQVATSTRRFEARGYLRQGLRWLYEALLPLHRKRRRHYDVIR